MPDKWNEHHEIAAVAAATALGAVIMLQAITPAAGRALLDRVQRDLASALHDLMTIKQRPF